LRQPVGNARAAGVPLNIVQRLLGRASIQTATIYTEASGPQEYAFAVRFWNHAGLGNRRSKNRCAKALWIGISKEVPLALVQS
jgi:hypothetical protein